MNELPCADMDIDWVEDLEEPGELLWTGDGWSLADRPVASAAQRLGGVSGLDSQGCSIWQNSLDLQRLFKLDECVPVAA